MEVFLLSDLALKVQVGHVAAGNPDCCCMVKVMLLVPRYTPNTVVELLPHRHCVGATLIVP